MSIKSGQTVTVLFTTQTPATGAATNADALPTGLLYVNGVVNAAVVTVSNITTGVYKAAVTLPALTAGDLVSLRISATVATIAGEACIWQDVADTKRTSDLNDLDAAGVRTAVGLASANLDTQLTAIDDYIDTEVAAIKAKTDLIGASVALESGGNLAAVKAKTDNLPTSPAAVGSAMTLADGAITAAVIATGAIDADAIAADAIGASELAADAVTEIQSGLATSANQTTILANQATLLERIGAFTGTGVNTILGFLKALASKAASLPSDIGGTFTPTTDSLEALQENEEEIDADVWAYTTRTLTQSAASVTAAVTGSDLAITAYVDYAATLTGLTIPSTWTKMWFTVKLEEEDADSESIIQIQVSNPADATNDGLLYLEGAAYATKTDGSLTVNQSGGTVAIALKAAATDGLTRRRKLGYDVKVLTSAGARTQLTLGSCDVVLTETHALS
jgi:hypothetical protein